MNFWEITLTVLMGFSLAAACGLRAFLPLFIIGIAIKGGFIVPAGGFEWMGSWASIICFGTATILEILGDKIPAVDHMLDAGGIFVRPVAGAIAASSLISGIDPLMSMVIGIILGSVVAGTVQVFKGAARFISTASTGGVANPVLSSAEDGLAAVWGVLGIFLPYLAAAMVIAGLIFGVRAVIKRIAIGKKRTIDS